MKNAIKILAVLFIAIRVFILKEDLSQQGHVLIMGVLILLLMLLLFPSFSLSRGVYFSNMRTKVNVNTIVAFLLNIMLLVITGMYVLEMPISNLIAYLFFTLIGVHCGLKWVSLGNSSNTNTSK